jgi:hypothetical protein
MLEEKTQDLMVNMQAVLPLIVTNALSALGAIVILLIGLWLSGKADQLVVRMLSRTPHFDPTLKSFFGSLARYLILTVTLLAVLSQFGIQTTSLVAVIGAASLAVGLALQGTLSNLAAGIMLLIFRPFRVGLPARRAHLVRSLQVRGSWHPSIKWMVMTIALAAPRRGGLRIKACDSSERRSSLTRCWRKVDSNPRSRRVCRTRRWTTDFGLRRPSHTFRARGSAAAHNAAITQNPCAPKFA